MKNQRSGRKLSFFRILLIFLGVFLVFYAVSRHQKTHKYLRINSRETKVMNPNQQKEWKKMTSRLKKYARNYSGYVGIYLEDLSSGKEWTYKADRLFPSASLIKVPIMAAIFEKIKSGEISFDTTIKLTRRERKGGSGTLKWAKDGTNLSVMELIYKMITESDNTATNMLIDYVGMEYLQHQFEKMGLKYTNISPEGMSLSSRRVAKENYTTAREMAYLFKKIYYGKLVNKKASELMLEFLRHSKSRTRLRRGLPIGWEIGHKTGLLRRACHDAGIVFSPNGDYIIVVLTGNVPSYSSAKRFITRIGRETVRYYKKDMSFADSKLGKTNHN